MKTSESHDFACMET